MSVNWRIIVRKSQMKTLIKVLKRLLKMTWLFVTELFLVKIN